MIKILPTFKGYTVDIRLKEFRKARSNHGLIEFLPFDSSKGEKLLNNFMETLDEDTTEGRDLLIKLWAFKIWG